MEMTKKEWKMIAKLEFDTDEPQQQRELKLCVKAVDMSIALWDIDQMFRRILKYDETITEDQDIIVEALRKEFWDILKNQDVEMALEG